jgi:hypothetical protein
LAHCGIQCRGYCHPESAQSIAVLGDFAELEYLDRHYSEFFFSTCEFIGKKQVYRAELNSRVWMISGELSTWVQEF